MDALLVAFLLGGLFGPPDPITQLLVIPVTFLLALPVTYSLDTRLYARGWRRHALFLVGVLATQFVWQEVVRFAVDNAGLYSPVRLTARGLGTALAAWLAYFGGLERLRGEQSRT
ncbi:hypothetical protein [Halorussus sp. AFM4]|uniref:hypothetical protein n=1 Tax=Halorussus sp. AFM4 TaxID=3421651 RepID=UPI003EB97E09